MKRSKMLEILKNSVYKHQQDMLCCSNENELFDHILTDLENAGMQPPNITLDELIPCDLKTSEESEKHWYACWEPEND